MILIDRINGTVIFFLDGVTYGAYEETLKGETLLPVNKMIRAGQPEGLT